MKTVKLILLGLMTFLITAATLTPTAFVAPYLEKAVSTITLATGSGTIWNGQATDVRINNIDLGRVRWTVRPIKSLLSLSLVTDFEIKSEMLTSKGQAAYTYERTIRLTEVAFEADASLAATFQRDFKLGGSFQGFITSANLTPNVFPVINGVVNWVQGSLVSPLRLDPANYRAEISSSNNTLTADISASDGPINLSGLASVNSEWQYEADILAQPQAGISPLIRNVLRNAAGGSKAAADGSIRINRKGSMQPIPLYQ